MGVRVLRTSCRSKKALRSSIVSRELWDSPAFTKSIAIRMLARSS